MLFEHPSLLPANALQRLSLARQEGFTGINLGDIDVAIYTVPENVLAGENSPLNPKVRAIAIVVSKSVETLEAPPPIRLAACCDDITRRFTGNDRGRMIANSIFTGADGKHTGILLLRSGGLLPNDPDEAATLIAQYVNNVLCHKRGNRRGASHGNGGISYAS